MVLLLPENAVVNVIIVQTKAADLFWTIYFEIISIHKDSRCLLPDN